jgi:hypothetical protein
MWWQELMTWCYVYFGVKGFGPYYGFWSGFGSDLGEATIVTAIFGLLFHVFKVNNCEVHHCWRIGRHKTLAGHCVCRKHHPDHATAAPTAGEVATAHEVAKAEQCDSSS